MATHTYSEIKGIVFDLDGTLYVCERFASEIQAAAAAYIAGLKRITPAEAGLMITATRQRLTEESGTVQTLSAVCTELEGSVQELHRFFERTLRPEALLVRDERVIQLMKHLAKSFALYIYTNNNRVLTARIMNYLGLDGVVCGTFTIDDTWLGKPDEGMVQRVLEKIGLSPQEALFVGERYDVDLRMPEQLGCPVYLSQNLEQLLRLEELLTPSLSADRRAAPACPPAVRS
ncbi:MAG: HAD family hydrolase [Desulfuromonadaceae bacterium]|nr:HAD family hydrolase [Desulfuromonadaceae bacterium]